MKDPKILLSRIRFIFDVVCFFLALYMTLKNVGRFEDDTNETAIIYKKYGTTIEDKYPSFTVCFEGNNLYRFNESAIFAAYGIHLHDYEMMADGKVAYQYKYDPSTRRYVKTSVPGQFEPSIGLKEGNLFQLPDIVNNASFVAEKKSQRTFYKTKGWASFEQEETPFYINYQSSKLFCITRKHHYHSDIIRRYDSLSLDVSSFEFNLRVKVFIHYPGHLLRSFDTPRIETLVTRFPGGGITLKVSQTTVLRKRSVRNDRCNEDIGDHDIYLLESVINDTHCIPPYWSNIIGATSSLEECNSPEKLKKAHELTSDYTKIWEDREAPCIDMFSSVTWNEETDHDLTICERCKYLKIVYLDKYYEEIKEAKAFGFEDFISGLGGFIGIFLGYSMMQIPHLLGE